MGDQDQRRRKVLAGAGVGFVLVFVGVVTRTDGFPIIRQYPSLEGRPSNSRPPQTQPSQGTGTPPSGEANPLFEVILQILLAVVVIAVAAAVGFIVVKVIQHVVGQQRPTDSGDDLEPESAAELRAAVSAHLTRTAAALDVEGEVNTVIVRCWEGLEQIAARTGTAREATQTAREFTRTVLGSVDLPQPVIDRLADLYEAALFSGERLPEQARTEAIRCLEDLLAAAGDSQ